MIVVGLAIGYKIFADRIKSLKGWPGFLANFLFYIPCMLSDGLEYLLQQYKITPNIVFVLLLIELVLVLGYFYIPVIIQKTIRKTAIVLQNKPVYLDKEVNVGNIESQIGSAISLIAILTSVVFTRSWPLSWKVYTGQNLILPLSAGSAISMGRYISPIFPIFYSACQFLVKREYKYIIVFLLLISQLILYGFWLSSHPLSY
jgi:hypothetical protein